MIAEERHRLGAMGTLVRPSRGRIIAGVCAGLARRFGVSSTLVRVLFVVSCVLPGPQVLAYLALWVIMPSE
jgi:phage shock protein PspC (stress-responsive transcriptional regulator)